MVYIVAKCEDGVCRPVSKKAAKCDVDGKPKKPLSDYQYFLKHYFASMKDDRCFCRLSFVEKSAQAVRKWKTLDASKQKSYGKGRRCADDERPSSSQRKRACSDDVDDKLMCEITRMVKLTNGRSSVAKDKLRDCDFTHTTKRQFVELLRVIERASGKRGRACEDDMSELDSEDESSSECDSDEYYASEPERRSMSRRNPCGKRRLMNKDDQIEAFTRAGRL